MFSTVWVLECHKNSKRKKAENSNVNSLLRSVEVIVLLCIKLICGPFCFEIMEISGNLEISGGLSAHSRCGQGQQEKTNHTSPHFVRC